MSDLPGRHNPYKNDPQDDESSEFCRVHRIDYFPSDCYGWCPKCWTEFRTREAKKMSSWLLRETLIDIGSTRIS